MRATLVRMGIVISNREVISRSLTRALLGIPEIPRIDQGERRRQHYEVFFWYYWMRKTSSAILQVVWDSMLSDHDAEEISPKGKKKTKGRISQPSVLRFRVLPRARSREDSWYSTWNEYPLEALKCASAREGPQLMQTSNSTSWHSHGKLQFPSPPCN